MFRATAAAARRRGSQHGLAAPARPGRAKCPNGWQHDRRGHVPRDYDDGRHTPTAEDCCWPPTTAACPAAPPDPDPLTRNMRRQTPAVSRSSARVMRSLRPPAPTQRELCLGSGPGCREFCRSRSSLTTTTQLDVCREDTGDEAVEMRTGQRTACRIRRSAGQCACPTACESGAAMITTFRASRRRGPRTTSAATTPTHNTGHTRTHPLPCTLLPHTHRGAPASLRTPAHRQGSTARTFALSRSLERAKNTQNGASQ